MSTWIALFRGINVGGNRILPMKELVRDLERLGCANVRTYIQSGNAVFETPRKSAAKLAEDIAGAIEERHGFRPRVLVLGAEELASAIDTNPFPEASAEPKTLHLFFLAAKATKPDRAALDRVKTTTERYRLVGQVFYLHAPDGLGKSKLAASVEKHLGVEATARNWRTVQRVLELARST
jgi:uncharacterized protein (DUF1697 family)